jgi:hypothetical protein
MEAQTYFIKVKTEYASAVLEELQQNNAIELIPDDVPLWQQQESLRRLQYMKNHPETNLDSETFFNNVPDVLE